MANHNVAAIQKISHPYGVPFFLKCADNFVWNDATPNTDNVKAIHKYFLSSDGHDLPLKQKDKIPCKKSFFLLVITTITKKISIIETRGENIIPNQPTFFI